MTTSKSSDLYNSKKSIKWFQPRIQQFNDAVPFHVNALTTCRNNIHKFCRIENYAAVKQERVSAEKVIRNLKQLLIDIDVLKQQVQDSDLEKFDKLVKDSCERVTSTLLTFTTYYDTISVNLSNESQSQPFIRYNPVSKQNEECYDSGQILARFDEDKWELKQQLEVAASVERIEQEVQTVNEIFQDLAKIVDMQKEQVETVEENIEKANADVVMANKQLAHVAKMHAISYPAVGALVGSCVGGPVGFVAGLKIGALVAFTGSMIGFSGGQVLKKQQSKKQKELLEHISQEQSVST